MPRRGLAWQLHYLSASKGSLKSVSDCILLRVVKAAKFDINVVVIQERKRNFVKPNIMKVLGAVYCYSNAEMLLVDLEVCQTQHQY